MNENRPSLHGSFRDDPDAFSLRNEESLPVVDLGRVFRTLWRGKWFIAACVAIAIFLAINAVKRIEPVFTSTAMLLLASDEATEDGTEVLSEQKLATEVEIIHSASVLGRVVDQLELAAEFESLEDLPEELGLVDQVRARVMSLVGSILGDAPFGEGEMSEAELEAATTTDDEPLEEDALAADEEFVEVDMPTVSPRSVAIAFLRDNLVVQQVSESRVVALSFSAGDPETAAIIANSVARNYIVDRNSAKQAAREQQFAWLNERVDALRSSVRENEDKVEARRAELSLQAGQGLEITRRQLDARSDELAVARGETAGLELDYQRLSNALSDVESIQTIQEFRSSEPIQALLAMKQQIAEQLDTLSDGAASRELLDQRLIDLDRRILQAAQLVVGEIQADLQTAQAREQLLTEAVRSLESQALEQTRAELDLRQLERDAEVTRRNYEELLRQLLRSTGGANLSPSDIRILSEAEPPESFDNNRANVIYAFSLVNGVAFGAGIVLWRSRRRGKIRTIQDVEEATRMPVIGSIPKFDVKGHGSFAGLFQPNSRVAERLLGTCTHILRPTPLGAPQLIAFSSPTTAEGGSSVAMLCAIQLSKLRKSCLIIDCKLRAPSANWFSDLDQTGLSDVLAGKATLESAIWFDSLTELSILPAGREGVAGSADINRLYSDSFREVLTLVKSQFDVVILDLPPIQSAPESWMVAASADMTTLVAKTNKTLRQDLISSILELRNSGAYFGGTILTGR